jgi:hypothetical protein
MLLCEHEPLGLELGATQRCATPQRARLRNGERISTLQCSASADRGIAGDRKQGYVGGCRSLARHAGPFPFERKPAKSPARPRR